MIAALGRIMRKNMATGEVPDDDRALRLATAALLMEVASIDDGVSEVERDRIHAMVLERYDVTPAEAREIAQHAERDVDQATSVYPFTRLLNEECSLEERIEIVGMMWQVSMADGHIDAHETHIIRKIADLLYVPHSRFVQERLKHSEG